MSHFQEVTRDQEKKLAVVGESSLLPNPTNTRSFPKFSLEHTEIAPFTIFLKGIECRRKPDTDACAITTDVSKFLMFSHPIKPRWETVIYYGSIQTT